MRSSLIGIDPKLADSIALAVLNELGTCGIDESAVELTGRVEGEGEGVLSISVVVNGASSRPLLIDRGNFKTSLEEQLDLLRTWLQAGYPSQLTPDHPPQYKAGDVTPIPGSTEPMVAVRDSKDSRVWVVSARARSDEPIPYLIFPDGTLVKEQRHGLPD